MPLLTILLYPLNILERHRHISHMAMLVLLKIDEITVKKQNLGWVSK
jgi:hypothetical protein